MKVFNTTKYLESLYDSLLNECQNHKIELTRAWASDFPSTPGVYIFRDKKKVIYVGETGNLRGRMKDMIDTRNHVLRRNIGNKLYSAVKGFERATASKKFTDVIENMLNTHIRRNLTVCCMPVSLGRKELEEKIQKEFKPEYNQKGLRKSS
jgi:Nuclease subunit of the excinuclease complex